MKIYIHYTPSPEGEALGATIPTTLAIKLPLSWLTGPVSPIVSLFLSNYQKKLDTFYATVSSSSTPPVPLNTDTERWHIVSAKGEHLPHTTIIQDYIANQNDTHIHPSPPPSTVYSVPVTVSSSSSSSSLSSTDTTNPSSSASSSEPLLYCRNFACMKQYRASENHSTACTYHSKPPLFHETKKSWTCCPHRTEYDWDDFVKIPGCTIGPHSIEDPKIKLAVSPTVLAANTVALSTPSPSSSLSSSSTDASSPSSIVIKSIENYNSSNPNAANAASSVMKTLATRPKAVYRETDQKYKCIRKGCQQWFSLAENTSLSCTHHAGAPIFHDAQKSWSCCKKGAFEFDDFVNLPGCTTIISHDPGEL